MSVVAGGDVGLERVDVMRPWLGEEEVAAVTAVLRSGWVAQGPRVAAFEEEFARVQQAGHARAVSSCTAALHLALVVVGVGAGDDVVVPSFSFVATANAVAHAGARPVFADVDAVTGNLTAATVERALTRRTRAVVVVDQGGVPVDLDDVRRLCDPLGITVVEDAACAAGSTYGGAPVGSGADVAAWSFHPRKVLTTGEGGMLTTRHAAWAERARLLREHAMSVSAAERHASLLSPLEEYTEVGFNYRMTDLQAAVGLVQLGRLPEAVRRRRELAATYAEALADVPGLRAVTDPPHGESNFQSYWVEVGPAYPVGREALMAELAAAGVSARRGIMAIHRQPAWAGAQVRPGSLPVTERLTDHTLVLPLFHELTEGQQARVVDVLVRAGRST